MLNFVAIWLKTSLSLPRFFGGLFSIFLMLLCLVELCLKAELKLELLFTHAWVASNFQRSLSACFLSLSFSLFILYFSVSVNFSNQPSFFPEMRHLCRIFLDVFDDTFYISVRWLLAPSLKNCSLNSDNISKEVSTPVHNIC